MCMFFHSTDFPLMLKTTHIPCYSFNSHGVNCNVLSFCPKQIVFSITGYKTVSFPLSIILGESYNPLKYF